MEEKVIVQSNERHLEWEGCYNIRELGGLPTQAGLLTRRQSVIRADLLGQLTPVGERALIAYGVRTIIDLRGPKELEEEPSIACGAENELAYLHLSLEKYDPAVSELIDKAATRSEIYCIILDHYPDSVAAIMRAVANAQPGGIVVHCHGGMDRTGIVSALLLALAGVPAEEIVDDYAQSQTRLWPLYEKLVVEAGGAENLGRWMKPLAKPEIMHAVLAHLAEQYGGAQAYLEAAGLSSAEIARIKERLHAEDGSAT
jgi:protein-tyrosine phosphatase